MISVVSPVYNSATCLEELVKKIILNTYKITKKIEIVLVDDGSTDNSWNIVKKLKKKYKFIKGIKFNKNYGQHKAIYFGVKVSSKNLIIVMDCDLQDNPAFIIEMYRAYLDYKKPVIIEHSYENFNVMDRFLSNIFWYFLSIISLKRYFPSFGNYILINKKIKKKYISIKNVGYFYGDLINLGNKFITIKKKRDFSLREKSTYNLSSLIILGTKLILKYNLLNNILKKKKKSELSKIKIKEII
jgi:dolichol-phosphate mannosyltransferase